MKNTKVLLLAFIAVIFLTTSCKEDESDRYGIRVKVVNEADVAVPNADVEVFAPVENTLLSYTGVTDINGYAIFEYNNAAAAVVRAVKGPNGGNIWVGCNEKTLKAGVQVEIVVVIRQRPDTTIECDI